MQKLSANLGLFELRTCDLAQRRLRFAVSAFGGKHRVDDEVAHELTCGIAQQDTPKIRLRYLLHEWGFRLPMASAILTVLYPDIFTIYDTRVCTQMGDYNQLQYTINFDEVCAGYERFRKSVVDATPDGLSLRDRDRFVWGKAFCERLTNHAAKGFGQGGQKPDEAELPAQQMWSMFQPRCATRAASAGPWPLFLPRGMISKIAQHHCTNAVA